MSQYRSSIVEKLVAGLALAFAFIVMASIFTPADSAAGHDDSPQHHEADNQHASPDASNHSTDPHLGLASLGSVESDRYRIMIYSTENGPRYSVYDSNDNTELGVLLTEKKIEAWFPDIKLRDLNFDTPDLLMLAEPEQHI